MGRRSTLGFSSAAGSCVRGPGPASRRMGWDQAASALPRGSIGDRPVPDPRPASCRRPRNPRLGRHPRNPEPGRRRASCPAPAPHRARRPGRGPRPEHRRSRSPGPGCRRASCPRAHQRRGHAGRSGGTEGLARCRLVVHLTGGRLLRECFPWRGLVGEGFQRGLLAGRRLKWSGLVRGGLARDGLARGGLVRHWRARPLLLRGRLPPGPWVGTPRGLRGGRTGRGRGWRLGWDGQSRTGVVGLGLRGGLARGRGGLGHAAQDRAILRVAQPHHAFRADVDPPEPLRPEEGPVGAADVLEDPLLAVDPQHTVPPGHSRVGHDDVRLRIPADAVRGAGLHLVIRAPGTHQEVGQGTGGSSLRR